MQDKETVDEAEEALTTKAETISDRQSSTEKKDSFEGHAKKDSNKDGKFAFKKMKQPKKEKSDKKSPSRFEGEGVVFKAKLIGVEAVPEPRGDKMCQDAMQRLKLNVRNTGPHKRKININVSLQGIKIKDDKFGSVIYHHPVSLISFISQDITDARAFGYIFGSTSEPHQFIAIKTEKPAFHLVLALRDLFQTVLNHTEEEIDTVKETTVDSPKTEKVDSPDSSESKELPTTTEEQKPKEENIYFEVHLTEPFKMREENTSAEEPVKSVDDLLDLQNERNKLLEGLNQIDTSIAAAAVFNSEDVMPENDPFDTSFVLGPKRDSFPLPMPTPIPLASPVPVTDNTQFNEQSTIGDKYAVFNVIDTEPSVFETPAFETEADATADVKESEDEPSRKSAPAKPPRQSKTASPDLSVFADLDPLGKDRPYKDKTEFFQDVKNPPKKVLNDLVDPSRDQSKVFDVNVTSPSVPFPVDFESMSTTSFVNSTLSTSLPNSFPANAKLSLACTQNGNSENPYNPFENLESNIKLIPPPKGLASRRSEPVFPVGNMPNIQMRPNNANNNTSYLGKSPPSNAILEHQEQLTINCTMANANQSQLISQQSASSSPIPIPPRHTSFNKDMSFSNGSMGSPYSKSPIPLSSESPNNSDYYYTSSENYSPTGLSLKNALNIHQNQFANGENGNNISLNTNNSLNKHNINNFSNSVTNSTIQNGVSRPRPRPSLNKGNSVANNGHSLSSHSLSSDSSSDYEVISRENMQSIANVLLTNGHRLRAQSLCLESNNDLKLQLPGEKNIFAKKNDPFADDFFFSLPKKTSHLTKTEIPEFV